jgi:predicted  nucleic acid-binding Zn-ribbon protein
MSGTFITITSEEYVNLKAQIEDLKRLRALWHERFDHMAMQIADLERELAEAKETIAQMEDVMDGAAEMLRGEDN